MSGRRNANPLSAENALGYALDLLSRQGYSRAQLALRLQRRGLDEATVTALLGRLEALRLIDDQEYASGYLRVRRKERGRLGLRQELLRKGIAEGVIEDAMRDEGEGPLDDHQQLAAARALLLKHSWRFPPEPMTDDEQLARQQSAKRRQRVLGFLARRGFSVDIAIEAIEELLANDSLGGNGLTP
jgi:regulatory protein